MKIIFTCQVLRCIAEGVATRDGVCAYDSFCTSKLLKTKGLLCMREDRLAACGTRSSNYFYSNDLFIVFPHKFVSVDSNNFIGSDTSLGRGARAGMDGSTHSCERAKRNHSVVRRVLNEAGNNAFFTPIVISTCGAMGPSMVAFLKEVYSRAKEANKLLMSQQPALKQKWNTAMVSSFWDMRLSIACAATDADYQNSIILQDNTLNFPVVMRQPHPVPN